MQLIVIGHITSEVKTAIDIAQGRGAKVFFADNITAGIESLRNGKGTDMVLIDVGFDIHSFISAIKSEHISTPVIAFGINSSPKEAVDAINAGAKEFLPLPPDEILIAAIISTIADNTKPMIASAASMKQVVHVASKVAKSDAHILITGKSGTGKEVLAHYIHNNSLRNTKPFVKVNCAAIPENLIESELFGHEKGAFTGAIARRIGKFEESSSGTLLLDEISEMDIRLQAKLLRAIQEKEINRVGGNEAIKVDLRIIATSNRDLQHEIVRGNFREDLYFRLNIISIELPSLSARAEDIEDLSKFFIDKYCKNNRLATKSLTDAGLKTLREYNWPGNIRELENVIHRAVLLSDDQITENEIVLNKPQLNTTDTNERVLRDALTNYLGDSNVAASILGASIADLKQKLDAHKN